jgi:hypothetical protein
MTHQGKLKPGYTNKCYGSYWMIDEKLRVGVINFINLFL